MKSPEIKLLFASGLLVAASVSGSGNAVEKTLSPVTIPTDTGSPTKIENTYHLIPVPCKIRMPWESVSQEQKPTAESVVIFASLKIPKSKTTPGIGPECWEIVPTNLNS